MLFIFYLSFYGQAFSKGKLKLLFAKIYCSLLVFLEIHSQQLLSPMPTKIITLCARVFWKCLLTGSNKVNAYESLFCRFFNFLANFLASYTRKKYKLQMNVFIDL